MLELGDALGLAVGAVGGMVLGASNGLKKLGQVAHEADVLGRQVHQLSVDGCVEVGTAQRGDQLRLLDLQCFQSGKIGMACGRPFLREGA